MASQERNVKECFAVIGSILAHFSLFSFFLFYKKREKWARVMANTANNAFKVDCTRLLLGGS
jgi:hypothetical protein